MHGRGLPHVDYVKGIEYGGLASLVTRVEELGDEDFLLLDAGDRIPMVRLLFA